MNDDEEGSIWDEEVKQPQMASGFPTDDEYSLVQGDHGGANLDIYYANQFVQGERHKWKDWKGKNGTIDLIIVYTPVLKGTLVGSVFNKDNVCVAVFGFSEVGKIHYLDQSTNPYWLHKLAPGMSAKIINSGSLNEITGELSLNCNLDEFDLVLDYEYNIGF